MNREEFVKKYHTTKTLLFTPPTWEEFLASRDTPQGILAHWFCDHYDISIILVENESRFQVSDLYGCYSFRYILDDYFNNQEEMYYKAIEFAKNLFEGDKYE